MNTQHPAFKLSQTIATSENTTEPDPFVTLTPGHSLIGTLQSPSFHKAVRLRQGEP